MAELQPPQGTPQGAGGPQSGQSPATPPAQPSGQGEAPIQPPVQPAPGQAQEDGQGEVPGMPDNWMDSPQFAKLKAQFDRNLQAARTAAERAQQENQQLAARLESLETADLDDYGRLQHSNKKLEESNQQLMDQLRQRDEMDQLYQMKVQDTQELSKEYGVDQMALMRFDTLKEAEAHARAEWKKQVLAGAKGKGGAPPVDVGGGTGAGTGSRLDAEIARAREMGDTVRATKLAWLGEDALD